ncbi:hypothetical protein LCGC14_2715080, partial [marine sediment metagenome]
MATRSLGRLGPLGVPLEHTTRSGPFVVSVPSLICHTVTYMVVILDDWRGRVVAAVPPPHQP